MKRLHFKLTGVLLLAATLFFSSCEKDADLHEIQDPEEEQTTPPDAATFARLQEEANRQRTQRFQFDVGNEEVVFASEEGVKVVINPRTLQREGRPVSGTVEIEFIELYRSGDMLATNKRTMGKTLNGETGMITTGGAFYINAYQEGEELDQQPVEIQLLVPTDLTGGMDEGMVLWTGAIGEDNNLTWTEDDLRGDPEGGKGGHIGMTPDTYDVITTHFGWTNVDRFMSDDREKTELWVEVPDGYDWTNAHVYVKYVGEPNALADLDVYDTDEEMFTEHYGFIPIGLECHLIFVSEQEGNWLVGTQSVTIEEDTIYTFDLEETEGMSEQEMVDTIDALP